MALCSKEFKRESKWIQNANRTIEARYAAQNFVKYKIP